MGARKIRELLVRRLDADVRIPARSTIHAVLHRHRLVKGLPSAAPGAHLTRPGSVSWPSIDFLKAKGAFSARPRGLKSSVQSVRFPRK